MLTWMDFGSNGLSFQHRICRGVGMSLAELALGWGMLWAFAGFKP